MSAFEVSAALIALLGLLLAGALLRRRSRLLTGNFVPASLVAGAIGLAFGAEGLGAVPAWMVDVWSSLPGLLINVVFAGLFLGIAIPGPRAIWRIAGPQVAFGQTIAWGQYVVGLLLAITVLTPIFGLPHAAGALIEIGFEGGHGTAAGMAPVFEAFGFEDGLDIALGLSTVGVVGAVVIGMAIINWGARRGIIQPVPPVDRGPQIESVEEPGKLARGRLLPGPEIVEPLTLIAGFIGAAILLGWLMLQGLTLVEELLWAGSGIAIIRYIPLFPFAMLGGIVIQIALDRAGKSELLDRGLVVALQGLALDLLITSAIAALSLAAIGRNFWPFVLLAAAGTAWCLFCFFVLGPRYMRTFWFERAIADYGQSMGMTASGLLLLRVSDPKGRSPALMGFGYTQLLFEPIVGGGLFTAAAIPLIVGFGALPILVLTATAMFAWMAVGLFYFGRLDIDPAQAP